MNLSQQILSSSQILYMHTKNQIMKMQIDHNLLTSVMSSERDPSKRIRKMIQMFQTVISEKNLKIKLNKGQAISKDKLRADWRIYQMVLFNVFQNAVKYNCQNGKIDIELSLNRCQSGQISSLTNRLYELETRIVDTGEGIGPERIRHLFKPYGELVYFGKLKLVKHHSIGLGLSNSKVFMNFVGGKIHITKCGVGRTEVTVKIPVQLERESLSINIERNNYSPLSM